MIETTLTRERVAASTGSGWWDNLLLGDVFAEWVTAEPNRTAVVDGRRRLTYRELATEVDDLALGLLDLGVRRGDVVALQLPNWWEFVAVMLAVERIGAIVNPIAPIFRERELSAMFRLARPVVAVAAEEFRGHRHAAALASLKAATPSLRTVVSTTPCPEADLSLAEVAERGRRGAVPVNVLPLFAPNPDDVAQLIFTSGTTGEPKGVLHTHNTLFAGVRGMVSAQQLGPGEVFHMASTFAHQTGYLFGARICLQTGGTGVYQDHWDPVTFARIAEREGVTMSCGATPYLADLLRVEGLDRRDLSAFRIFGCFGAPIPRPLLEEAGRRLTVRVMPGWGMTEVNLATTATAADPADRVVTTDGRPMPGMEVRVVGTDGGEVGPDVEGDLLCRGAASFVGYLQGRVFTEERSTDGWLQTGDRARVDQEGFLRITGRTKDLLIRGGENVPVKHIEDVLAGHPKVDTVALVGVPDPRLGEIGCACIIASDLGTPTMAELQDFLAREQVTRQFWPERVEIFTEFPTTPSGKVQKFRLRKALGVGAAGRSEGSHGPGC